MAAPRSRRRRSIAWPTRAITFDRHYIGSMPCMPARRDLLTGRLTFLHRSWGPIEPFDNAFPDLLHQHGVYSHLVSDHYHYWEDGGATYHNRYDTFEFIRGQERDPWKAMVQPPWERLREMYHAKQIDERRRSKHYHHLINREFIKDEEEFTSVQCFSKAMEFFDPNCDADDWFLQIETFDPHEPFFAPKRFRERFPPTIAGRSSTGRLMPSSTRSPTRSPSCAPTTSPCCRCAISSSAACSISSTGATCGRTRRWWSPPTTVSCSASTTGGPRTG